MSIQQIISLFRPGPVVVAGPSNQILAAVNAHKDKADDKVHDSRGSRINTDNVTEAIRYQRDDALMNAMAAGLTTTRFGNL